MTDQTNFLKALDRIVALEAEVARIRGVLTQIAERDGRASDHISCYDCSDSCREASAALEYKD